MWQHLSRSSRDAFSRAEQLAKERNDEAVLPAHLFLALLDGIVAGSVLEALLLSTHLQTEEARLYVEATLESEQDPAASSRFFFSFPLRITLKFANEEANGSGSRLIEPEHLLLACLRPQRQPTVQGTLALLGWDYNGLVAKYRELRREDTRRQHHPLSMLTGNGQKALDAAYAAMRSTWCGRISTAHLLLGVLQDEHVVELLEESGALVSELKDQTRAAIRSDGQLATPDKKFDKGAKRALDRAKKQAQMRGHRFIGPEHILLGLVPQRTSVREVLTWGSRVPDAAAVVLAGTDTQKLHQSIGQLVSRPKPKVGKTKSDVTAQSIGLAAVWMFIAAVSLTGSLARMRAPQFSVLGRLSLALFFLLLLGNAMGACWHLLTSRKPNLKRTWCAAFFGFLFGTMVGMGFFMR